MAILSSTGIAGFLSSAKATGKQILNKAGKLIPEYIEDFLPGFTGHGWKIWNYRSVVDSEDKVFKKYKLEIDSITVRESMTVFELLIQKIRAVKGALSITQASGKVATAICDEDAGEWLLTVEDEMGFVAHDIVRCQSWENGNLKGYWVEISEIRKIEGVDTIVIPVSEFSGGIGHSGVEKAECVDETLDNMTIPLAGDEIIQFGNSQIANRQSAVYIHADEGGQPAIDILFGITSKSFDGCVKTRIGGDIPGGDGAKGFYCENGMIKGTDDAGHIVYCIYPDGGAEFGDGSAKFNVDKSGFIAGGAISWKWNNDRKKCVCTFSQDTVLTWDNLDDETKENLKGAPGPQGVPGAPGADGKVHYTWICYADDEHGNGMSNDPMDKKYIGLAHNKDVSTEGTNPTDYTWSLFRGEDGTDGVPGIPGADGKTTYTWIAYSDNVDGSDMYQVPNENTKYIGIAVNKDTITESVNPIDYTWSLFRGKDAIFYSIEVFQGDARITSLSCNADGTLKGNNTFEGHFYKNINGTKETCVFPFVIIGYKRDGALAPIFRCTSAVTGFDDMRFVDENWSEYDGVIVRCLKDFNYRNTICEVVFPKIIDGQPGVDANMLPWIKDWNGYVNDFGSDYIATPKMFSGKVEVDEQENRFLTGIAQGNNCITVGGVERSGIFALVDNNIVFELDPINKRYLFRGRIETASKGTRVIIDPTLNSEQGMYPGMTIYDTDGEIASTFNGSKITSIDDLYGASGELEYTMDNFSWSKNSSSVNHGDTITGTLLEITTDNSGVIRIPEINLSVGIIGNNPVFAPGAFYLNYASVEIYVNGIAIGHCTPMFDGYGVQNCSTQAVNLSVMKGVNVITYRIGYSTRAVSSGSVSLSVSAISKSKFVFVSNIYMSRYFANGFSLGSSTRNFFECLNVSNSMLLRAIMDNYGLNLTQSGIQLRLNGKWYTLGVTDGKISAKESSLLG